jgi:type I restriction enzyme R subunit
MVTQTNEQALEACIEKALTGTCRERLRVDGLGVSEANDRFRGGHLYWLGESGDFDREFAVDRRHFWRFLETTQADELSKITDRPQWKRLILERLNCKIQKEGIVHVLKSGLRIDNAHFTLFYSRPYNAINPEVAERFEQNIFSVTRQVSYSTSNPLKSIDMVIFLNGISVATLELKNAWTGQSTYHAMKQYREDRGDGHKTSYLWQDILSRQSLAAIIEHFTKLVGEKGNDPLKKKRLFFPRYHQLEVVRNIIADVRANGVGRTYLIQHSAGSGKSNSITCAAYQLIEVYPENGDRPIFSRPSWLSPAR